MKPSSDIASCVVTLPISPSLVLFGPSSIRPAGGPELIVVQTEPRALPTRCSPLVGLLAQPLGLPTGLGRPRLPAAPGRLAALLPGPLQLADQLLGGALGPSLGVLLLAQLALDHRRRAHRPDVVQVPRRVGRKERAVVLGVLAQQRGAVAPLHRLVEEPRRQRLSRDQLGIRPDLGDPGGPEVGGDRRGTRVTEPALGPDLARGQPVAAERLLVALPHQHRRMGGPRVPGDGEGPHDLDPLDPLLAQPFEVQGAQRLVEVGVRSEGLHRRLSPSTPAGTAGTRTWCGRRSCRSRSACRSRSSARACRPAATPPPAPAAASRAAPRPGTHCRPRRSGPGRAAPPRRCPGRRSPVGTPRPCRRRSAGDPVPGCRPASPDGWRRPARRRWARSGPRPPQAPPAAAAPAAVPARSPGRSAATSRAYRDGCARCRRCRPRPAGACRTLPRRSAAARPLSPPGTGAGARSHSPRDRSAPPCRGPAGAAYVPRAPTQPLKPARRIIRSVTGAAPIRRRKHCT